MLFHCYNLNTAFSAKVAVIALFVQCAGAVAAQACGVEWRVPVNHYVGVQDQGYVAYSSQIGEMDLGDGLKMPLIIDFQSDRGSTSPYIGHGWFLCLLDSHIVQTGENSFRMFQPDGWFRDFGRDNAQSTILNGQGGWKGKINTNTIELYAECGWKLTFTKGKLSAITTPKNRRFDFLFQNGRVTEIREGGSTKMRVELDREGVGATALIFNGRKLELEQSERPVVSNVSGQPVVTGMSKALHKVSNPITTDPVSKTFSYAVTEKVQPTMEVSEGAAPTAEKRTHYFVWDAETKRIVADKDGIQNWVYDIKPGARIWSAAAIGRTNDKGQREFWFIEPGKETRESLDGKKFIFTSFTSGLLNGKPRESLVYDAKGQLIERKAWRYDETGKLIRKIQDDSEIAYFTDRTVVTKAGKILYSLQKNSQSTTNQKTIITP